MRRTPRRGDEPRRKRVGGIETVESVRVSGAEAIGAGDAVVAVRGRSQSTTSRYGL